MRERLFTLVAAVVIFAAGALWSQYAPMPWAQAEGGSRITPLGPASPSASPVVGCTIYSSTMENEYDAFDQQLLRRTRTTINSIVLVRADGTTEVKRITPNN